MEHYFILTEGSQDVSVVHNLLLINGFKEIINMTELNEKSKVFSKLIPKKFPFISEKFIVFNIIPSFYIKENKIILLINPRGEKGILKRIDEYLESLELIEIENIKKTLVFLDADDKNREEKINIFLDPENEIKNCEMKIEKTSEKNIEIIVQNLINIKLSIFVLPTNKDCGTLEDIILEGVKVVDSGLYGIVDSFFNVEEFKFRNDADRSKALISCIGGILLPKGYSTAVNIRDKKIKWISEKTITLGCIETINSFLKTEIGI